MDDDKSLAQLLLLLEEHAPIIPDAITDFYLSKAGFESSDIRVKRLLALASQKFIADLASDAMNYSRIRSQSSVAQGGPKDKKGQSSKTSHTIMEQRNVLTMEDLAAALSEQGVHVKKPDYFSQ